MKIIILITAAFFTMPSVAAAADLPIGKYPVGAATRPAPARPGALGPREQGGGRCWAVKLQVDVPQWLLSNPNGPLPKEQEQSLLLELSTAKNAKQPAVALLSTIYSRQQADNPALQWAASELVPREWLGSESPDTAPYMEWLAIVSAGE
jgi:hypothetical protein